MDSIFETIKNTALIHKAGGGTGFSFSNLRPSNDLVKSTSGVSSGPISFMKVFDSATEVISQGGRRRGANMGVLRVDHPDILDFISIKSDLNKLNNFNLSIAITDVFMYAVEHNEKYNIINPRNNEVVTQYDAREVFDKIVEQAWLSGEPGLIFIDEANRHNQTPHIGKYETTNPCGEQLLITDHKTGGGESCNLGSINVSKFITSDMTIDYDSLKDTIYSSVCFLDNVIDMNNFPLPSIEKMTKKSRKIGLGIMGFADLLVKLHIPYSSKKALSLADELMEFINKEAYEYSIILGKERGVYPVYKKHHQLTMNEPCRNAARTTIAPTGTISILTNCSSGIEPIFSYAFVRRIMDDQEFFEVNPVFNEISKINNFYSDDVIKQLANDGTVKHIDGIPNEFKEFLESTHDISPEAHIAMQATFQKHVDSSISKTINFSKDATKEDVKKAYLLAYKSGCKGITIYRDGSRQNQVLNIGEGDGEKILFDIESSDSHTNITTPIDSKDYTVKVNDSIVYEMKNGVESIIRSKKDRPLLLNGSTYEMETGCGKIFVTINSDNGVIFENFNTIGKAGGCAASQCEAIGRLISLALRSGQQPEQIVKSLVGISCHKPFGFGDKKVLSCADAIAKAFIVHIDNSENEEIKEIVKKEMGMNSSGACPECGGIFEHEGGCGVCRVCGYSQCG
jgi:ribonucleoside-diphosphate reductase alpha chain